MNISIYILNLEKGKYYVGKTNDFPKRYQQHLNGVGSEWTKKYKPVSIEKVIENASPFDEDKYTKEYMSKFGIDNVRGGSYCNKELDESQIESLNREIWGAENKCARCGRNNHYQKDCYARTDVHGNSLEQTIWCCEKCDEEFESESECEKHEKYCKRSVICFKCKKFGHYANMCYSRR